jgi:hypothetical protein
MRSSADTVAPWKTTTDTPLESRCTLTVGWVTSTTKHESPSRPVDPSSVRTNTRPRSARSASVDSFTASTDQVARAPSVPTVRAAVDTVPPTSSRASGSSRSRHQFEVPSTIDPSHRSRWAWVP